MKICHPVLLPTDLNKSVNIIDLGTVSTEALSNESPS